LPQDDNQKETLSLIDDAEVKSVETVLPEKSENTNDVPKPTLKF